MENEMSGTCSICMWSEKCMHKFGWKTSNKTEKPLAWPRHRLEDNVKMDFKEQGIKVETANKWIRQTHLKNAMNFCVGNLRKNHKTSCRINSLLGWYMNQEPTHADKMTWQMECNVSRKILLCYLSPPHFPLTLPLVEALHGIPRSSKYARPQTRVLLWLEVFCFFLDCVIH